MNFIKLAKRGQELDPTIVVKVARSFKDELTLDNMSRLFLSFLIDYLIILSFFTPNPHLSFFLVIFLIYMKLISVGKYVCFVYV